MNKEIKFSMKFDTTDFDQAVGKMQEKLKTISGLGKGAGGPSGGAPGGPGGPAGGGASVGGGGAGDPMMTKPGMEAFYKSMQALRSSAHSAMAQHGKEQMKIMKDIAKEEERRGKLLQDQEKISKNKTKDLKEELRIQKELKATAESIARLNSQAGSSKTNFDAARGAAGGNTQPVFVVNWPDEGGRGGGAGGGGPGGGGKGRGGAGGSMMGRLSASLGTAAAVLATGATLIDNYTSTPLRAAKGIGSGTQSILGNQLQQLARGDVVPAMAWQKERAESMGMAQDKMKSDMITKPLENLAHSIAGMAAGATAGAIGGLLLGGPLGAIAGGVGGGIFGAVKAGGPDMLAGVSEKHRMAFEAERIADLGKNYEEILAAKQAANPLKGLAVDFLSSRYKGDVGSQRMMGMNDKGFYGAGGFLEQGNKGGFTGDMRMDMASQIQGAGGSTSAMKGSSSMAALRAQRDHNLTNAGSLMGTISSGAGGNEVSERIFKRLLEEGVRNGLDKSDTAEELRKTSQITADIVARTGAVTGEDTSRIMEGFSRFLNLGGGASGQMTMKDIEGAKASYNEYQGRSAETSGRRGALQFSAMQHEGLGKMGAQAIGSLMEMPEQDLTSTNTRVVALAEEYGMKPEDLVKKLLRAKQTMQDTDVNLDPKFRTTLQEYQKKMGIDGEMSQQQLEAAPQSVRTAYGEIMKASSLNTKYEGPQKATSDFLQMLHGGQTEAKPPVYGPEPPPPNQPGDRGADQIIASAGKAAQVFLENFREFKDQITPAATALDSFSKSLIIFAAVAAAASDKDKGATLAGLADQLKQRAAASAQQGGKPTPGGSSRGSSGGW